jgi:hypothetical protein
MTNPNNQTQQPAAPTEGSAATVGGPYSPRIAYGITGEYGGHRGSGAATPTRNIPGVPEEKST